MVNRRGEEDKFKSFSSLHNRRLLWHGSRLTNWVGIMSEGLRIAPPTAPGMPPPKKKCSPQWQVFLGGRWPAASQGIAAYAVVSVIRQLVTRVASSCWPACCVPENHAVTCDFFSQLILASLACPNCSYWIHVWQASTAMGCAAAHIPPKPPNVSASVHGTTLRLCAAPTRDEF